MLRRVSPRPGRTILATIALALALSVLPLPEGLRPFPSLREAPAQTVARLLVPSRPAAPVEQPPPPVLEDEALANEPMVFEPLDLTDDATIPAPRVKSAQSRKWDALLARVGGRHVPLTDPCRGPGCASTALTPWFSALDELAHGGRAPVRVVTLGTSLIASDHITDVLRRRLQERNGEGGLGFLFIDRPTRNAGRTVRSGAATEGWVIEKVTDAPPLSLAGFGGAAFTAPPGAPQQTSYQAAGSRRLELFAVAQPGGGAVQVLADGVALGELSLEGEPGAALFPSLALPEGVGQLTLKTRGGPVRLDGVVLERGGPGVVVDSLGLPGASASVLLAEDERLFSQQLAARAPALVILMIGGNDAFDLSLNRYPLSAARERMAQLVARVRQAVPGAACLLASPPDAGVWRMDQTLTPRTQTREVAAYMHELAEAHGCAWYDMQDAMGGEGAIERWWSAGLMNRDLVHPLALGADLMGYQLDEALRGARRRAQARAREEASVNGGRRPSTSRPRGQPPQRAPRPGGSAQTGSKPVHPFTSAGNRSGPSTPLGANGTGRPVSIDPRPRRHGRAPSLESARPSTAGPSDAGVALECAPAPVDAGVPTSYLHHPEALGRFFTRLRALETEGQGRVAIMQLGASHTAAHAFTDEGRRLLAERFGSAGRGFIAAGKASPRLERAGVSRALIGRWVVDDALKQRASGEIWGLTGVRAVGGPGASLSVSFDEPRGSPDDIARLQLYYLEQPDHPTPEVMIDGDLIPLELPPAQRTGVRVVEFAAPGHRHVLALSNPGPGTVSVFGVSQELMRPGIVYDALGLPGSTATTLASYEQEALGEQVRARQPDLFVFFYGTNESGLKAPRVEEMARSYPLLFATLRKAAPEADCLILAPTDRMNWKRGERGWRRAESLEQVTAAMQQVALEQGCAFWQTGEAMGGKGSIERWRRQKLALPDHVHLTTEGYQRLAGLTIGALLRAYDDWSGRP